MQFSYTVDRMGYYVAPASTVLFQFAVVEEDEIAYAPSTLGPGSDYSVAPIGQAPELREYHCGEERGGGLGNFINIILVH